MGGKKPRGGGRQVGTSTIKNDHTKCKGIFGVVDSVV